MKNNTSIIKKIFSPNQLWSSAIHEIDVLDFEKMHLKLKKVFETKTLRYKKSLPHTLADPFLIVKDDALYIFLESQSPNQPGKIISYVTRDLKTYESLGVILEEGFHLSYPFVFEYNNSHYILPESGEAETVSLYKFSKFPYAPKKIKTLLNGRYFDTSLFFYKGMWYLFTTSNDGLEIFSSNDLFNSNFKPHKKNPITSDPRYARSAGSLIQIDQKIYRPCQDCSNDYGSNINFMEITCLTDSEYAESKKYSNFFSPSVSGWNGGTGHHISMVNFMNKNIVATDKKQNDFLINKYISPIRI